MDQYWLTIIIVVLLIAGIVFDGVRRMRKARYDSLQMKLKPTKNKRETEEDTEEGGKGYGSEFPNGGARVSNRSIDPERIKEVRNKYNFGGDMSAWREKVVEKIAEHTGKLHSQDEEQSIESRIEPSFEADPLLDDISRSDDDDYQSYEEGTGASVAENSTEHSAEADDDLPDSDSREATDTDQVEPIEQEKPKIPVQVSLNLDESVPMLMDTFDEQGSQRDEKGKKEKASRNNKQAQEERLKNDSIDEPITKKSLNPFAKPSAQSSQNSSDTRTKKEPVIGDTNTSSKPRVSMPEEVLVIHVRASGDNVFYGSDLLELMLAHGLRFGAMDIFHCHAGEDGEGPILFSLSNMVKPGIFDLHTFEEFSTVGISLFLALPVETGSYMEAFEAMVDTAKDIANKLQGELKDENRSVLTGQTIEHYRERIRDFSRREQLEKHKL